MKTKTQLIAMTMTLVLVSAVSAARVAAQHSHDHGGDSSWKTGMLRLTKTAWAGEVRLQSGMYHVKHVVVGEKHWLVFKTVTLRAGYQEGFMWEGEEVTRLECSVEPVTKTVRNTKITFGRTSAGEPSSEEIQIAGEKVRHILMLQRAG